MRPSHAVALDDGGVPTKPSKRSAVLTTTLPESSTSCPTHTVSPSTNCSCTVNATKNSSAKQQHIETHEHRCRIDGGRDGHHATYVRPPDGGDLLASAADQASEPAAEVSAGPTRRFAVAVAELAVGARSGNLASLSRAMSPVVDTDGTDADLLGTGVGGSQSICVPHACTSEAGAVPEPDCSVGIDDWLICVARTDSAVNRPSCTPMGHQPSLLPSGVPRTECVFPHSPRSRRTPATVAENWASQTAGSRHA